jgi:hypothetical protein
MERKMLWKVFAIVVFVRIGGRMMPRQKVRLAGGRFPQRDGMPEPSASENWNQGEHKLLYCRRSYLNAMKDTVDWRLT